MKLHASAFRRGLACARDDDRVSSNDHLYRFSAALGATATGMVLSTSLALATGGGGEGGEHGGNGDSAQIEVTGYIAPTCTFTTLPDQTSFGQMVTDQEENLGNFGFTCNIATSSASERLIAKAT